jgi:hypothetical protein
MFYSLKNIVTACFILIFFAACSPLQPIEGFDAEAWRNDRNACAGIRDTMRATIERVRPQLKGLTESALIKMLGKPDRSELDERNRKHLIYFISKGSQCEANKNMPLGTRIKFSSSAMNVVNEALIEN